MARGVAGTVIGGRYTLVSPIGTGGMGAVWRGTDQLLHREVAIKEVVLPPGMPPTERAAVTERTMREARAAAALSHPAVIRVFDVVTDGGRPWIVMELLKADSLAALIERDGPLAPRAVAKIGLALLGALEAAHQAGVLHRDVKPGNVLIGGDGRCVLTDFGVARSVRDSDLTTPGMVLGSPHFISPERAIGGQFGPPSDLFSLGVTLYTAVEGRPPFDRGDAIRTMQAVVNDPPEPPQRAAQLTPVLYGLMEKDPAKRWNVEQTRAALRSLLLGPAAAPAAQPTQATTRLPVPPRPGQTGVIGVPGTAPGVAGGPVAVPTPGITDPWRVGRAAVANPGAVPAGPGAPAGVPGQPGVLGQAAVPGPVGAPYQGTGYPPVPGQPRGRGAWIFGAVAAVLAVVLMLTAVGYGSGWFSPTTQPSAEPQPDATAGPDFEVRTFQGRGFSLNVPASWRQGRSGQFIRFRDPNDETSWLQVLSQPASGTARQILRAQHNNFLRGCCTITNYQRVAFRPAQLSGHRGAELEYTGTRVDTGQHRHGIWRVVVVNGRNYQLYMSVPHDRFQEHKAVFDEAVRSMRLTG